MSTIKDASISPILAVANTGFRVQKIDRVTQEYCGIGFRV